MPKVLVTIANHGYGNQNYLQKLIAAYRSMPLDCEIIVLSDVPKDLGSDIGVAVGAPQRNPWSLPFAHRAIFKENIDKFEYFIYSEDDTLLLPRNLSAYIDSLAYLNDNEIAGFVRTEVSQSGELSYSTCHSLFRWQPGSTRMRNGELWAKYTNEHAACFIANQRQVRHAFASGGFPIQAHDGRYDMLVSAATDIYAACGLEKLVCIDRLDDFTIQHLPNKYLGKMGLSAKEVGWQLDALRRIHRGELSDKELFDPETRLPGGIGSKVFHEQPDTTLEDLIGDKAKRILIWGGGDGILEASIRERGHDVTVIPFNAIFGTCCSERGLAVVQAYDAQLGSMESQFDCAVTVDCLHLCEEPCAVLSTLRRYLVPEGQMLARVPNLNRPGILKHRWQRPKAYGRWNREQVGALALSPRMLRTHAEKAGFERISIKSEVTGRWAGLGRMSLGMLEGKLAQRFYLCCHR